MSTAWQPVGPGGIREFLKGRSLLITGATGFMGKVLIEKLLRTCHDVGTVYVLLRPKAELEARQRIEALLRVQVFDRLKKERPEALAKLVAVSGDLRTEELGLSAEDETLLTERVSLVFHVAATIRFDEKFRDAFDINVNGTKRVLDLCAKMRHLSAVVHVSTAFCNCDRKVVEEIVYPFPYTLRNISEALQWMDDDLIDSFISKLMGHHPNTYTFTKVMSEHLLSMEEYQHLPIVIVRPSVVVASWKEPVSGWIDNFNTLTGVMIGFANGIIRAFYMHEEVVCDFIPVDIAINMIIAVAWYKAIHRSNNLLVFNCVSRNQAPMTLGEVNEYINISVYQNPVKNVFWYPSHTICRSRFFCKLLSTLVRIFPLGFLDVMIRLTGKKPVTLRILQKFEKVIFHLPFFTTQEWQFITENSSRLWEMMAPQDRQDFHFDMRHFDWKLYIEKYFSGIKLYLLKEEPSALPVTRRQLRKKYLLFLLFRILGLAVFGYLLVTIWDICIFSRR